MIIHHITGSFGALQGQVLELKQGLNVIEAPNESGKSTWCALLRAMLYGINTRERDSKTGLADKNRYLPWSGKAMEGELYLTAGGRDILLRRSSRLAPFDTFSAVDAVTGAPIPGLTGENAGERLLGVGREVYERSAFLRQGGVKTLGGSDELEKRISALVSSGEEAVSYSQAEGRLREWLRRRKHNKTGLIPRLEEELAELDGQLLQLSSFSRDLTAALLREKGLEQDLREVEADLEIWQRLRQQEQNRRYARHKQDWLSAAQQAEEARRVLESLGALPERETLEQGLALCEDWKRLHQQSQLTDREASQAREEAFDARKDCGAFCFLGMTPDQAWQRADEDAAQVIRHNQAAGKAGRNALVGILASLLCGAALSALLWQRSLLLPMPCVLAGCGLFAAGALLSILLSRGGRKRHLAQKQALLEHYEANSAAAIRDLAAAYREACALADQAEAAALRKESEAQEARLRCAAVQNRLLALVRPFAPRVQSCDDAERAIRKVRLLRRQVRELEQTRDAAKRIFDLVAEQGGSDVMTLEYLEPPQREEAELEEARQALLADLALARSQAAAARGSQAALGDPAALRAQREELAEQLRRRREEYEALTLSLQALEEAGNRFRQRISPELNRRAAFLFSALTGGAYDAVTLSRSFEAQARPTGTLLPRGSMALSQGAEEQLYLAVRLALCELLLSGKEKPPVVLDDALCNFDDGRMALALTTLLERSRERQILLFTCHSRERKWLQRQGAPCNFPQMGI